MGKISKQELEFYRKHPELVQAVGDKATIYRWVLVTVFVAGFLLVVLSKAVKYGFIDAPAVAWVELAVDLIFEMGVALWGGVATTVLLQNFVERKYREGRQYQQEIIQRLAEKEEGSTS
jgi:hypothetical protein